jgi:hypothetical protein
MAIRRWHVGKIVLLWAWGIFLSVGVIQVVVRTTNFVPGFLLIGVLLAIPLTLSVITWKWLGGKEGEGRSGSGSPVE